MMFVHDKVKTEYLSIDVRHYIEEYLHRLQQKRIDTLRNTTLEDIFKSRNPYFLRAMENIAFKLISRCLDEYLAENDEMHFETFASELAVFSSQQGQLFEPSDIVHLFALERIPLRFELQEEYDRTYNRLLYRFYSEFCDEDTLIDWVRLAGFISEQSLVGKT